MGVKVMSLKCFMMQVMARSKVAVKYEIVEINVKCKRILLPSEDWNFIKVLRFSNLREKISISSTTA